jgi:hypothetical protein
MLHLLNDGGTVDPLFKKAVIESPGFVPQWDTSASGIVVNSPL